MSLLCLLLCARGLYIQQVAGWKTAKKKFAVRKNLEERASPELLTHLLFI